MTADFPQRVLFPVLRAGLDLADAVPELSEADAELLTKIAARQELLPVVYRAFSRCASAHPLAERLRADCEKGAIRYLMLEQALEELCEAFDRAQVPYLPLKGAALRRLYPEPWLRTSSDIDVLVPETELTRAAELLRQEAGYTIGERSEHDVSLLGPKAHVELHFRLHDGEDTAQNALLDAVWNHAKPAEGSCWELEPAFQIFYCLSHMSRHLRAQGVGIRPLTDLFLLCRSAGADEASARTLCEQGGLLRFYESAAALTEVWYAGGAHTPTTQALERVALGGGVFGDGRSTAYARKRKLGGGSAYYLRRLFLPRREMCLRYPKLKEHPALLPVFYCKRLSGALFRKNGEIRDEIRVIKKETEQSEQFAALLDELGL